MSVNQSIPQELNPPLQTPAISMNSDETALTPEFQLNQIITEEIQFINLVPETWSTQEDIEIIQEHMSSSDQPWKANEDQPRNQQPADFPIYDEDIYVPHTYKKLWTHFKIKAIPGNHFQYQPKDNKHLESVMDQEYQEISTIIFKIRNTQGHKFK